MNTDDITHLAALARIKLTKEEMVDFAAELPQIVSYVSAVQDIAGPATEEAPQVGARYNVFRPDKVTNQPDEFTADILAQMPETDGRYMKVKKILTQED